MKTTVEISDDLYRRAKAMAALRGSKLKDLFEEGLRRVLDDPSTMPSQKDLLARLKRASGIIDSGIGDLASNPKHLGGLGRDGNRHR